MLTVVLDPLKPAGLVVDYDTNTICPAGEALPGETVGRFSRDSILAVLAYVPVLALSVVLSDILVL